MHGFPGVAGVVGADQRRGNLKKKCELDAELAFWFGIDTRGMTRGEKLGFWFNLGRVKAQDRIHRGDYDECDYKGV